MVQIFNQQNLSFEPDQSPVSEYASHTSQNLAELVKSKHLQFNVRSLDPNKYSCPYHFHRNSEEIFVILAGKVTLRTTNEFVELSEGDIVFFEMGPQGAHQLYNHIQQACKYLDIRTEIGFDVCEYPDSGKINIWPYREIYQSEDKVDYYKGEEKVRETWKNLFRKLEKK
jgi:uncharacterized cupin superfamily protein